MALSATICKADLNIVDMDRHYYQQHSLTVAQHPSENDERLISIGGKLAIKLESLD